MRNERTFRPEKASKLDDPERQRWLPPAAVVRALDLAAGMTVADIGAGTGYFAIPIANAVAPGGRVLAVDFQTEMLDLLRERLAAPDAPLNIEMVEGEARTTHLPSASCDRVLIANVWHELDQRHEVIAEVGRILKPGGRLAVLDWRPDTQPPPGPPSSHRIPSTLVIAELEREGWNAAAQAVGTYSYVVLADRP